MQNHSADPSPNQNQRFRISLASILDKLSEIGARFPLAEGLSIIGGIWFAIQLWTYGHLQNSILDEGAYLYKGYLYATGQFRLYEDYGLWSNKMPLSFLVPGIVQNIFGPGLRTGRYYAIILAGIMLVGLYILARRLGGKWWGAGIVWLFALSPAIIQHYSMAASQVLVACILTWTLVLIVGKQRPVWQIGMGAFLAGLMAMTRINMFLVLPFLLVYIFWQHGRKSGILATSVAGITVLTIHAIYWPGIMMMWARVLPESLTPFLNPWRASLVVTDTWNPETTNIDRLLSLFLGIRFQFAAIIGAVTAWILWPTRKEWQSEANFKAAVLFSIIFLTQLLIHMYFAFGQNYCVFCFPGYLSFFSMTGLLLVVASSGSWKTRIPLWLQIGLIPIILLLATGIGFANFEQFGEQLLDYEIPKVFFDFPKLSRGTVTFDVALINKFNLEYPARRQLAPTITGGLAGVLIVVLALVVSGVWSIYAWKRKGQSNQSAPSFGIIVLTIFLLFGLFLLPSKVLAGGQSIDNCDGDAILAYEAIGEHLSEIIPPGSLVYWSGSDSVVPLLYIPEARIFPAQMNGQYSLKENGDIDTLLKFGFWSEEIAEIWLNEADYVLIEKRSFRGWIEDLVIPDIFEELEPSPQTVSCLPDTELLIFKRVP